ncbi:MAG TPA: GntR family transcriptional regulator [Streptosporangiaceae bacterium]|nr:GntR family transcriptional regulator [Streptosporangiaceae bacterium]
MPEPIYRQIAEDLRRQIEMGELRPGEQLRTEIELRDHYSASRNTIRDAIKLLVTRGLVETRPGQGTFVVEMIVPFITTLTGPPDSSSGEGDTYSQQVGERRRPRATIPEVGIHQAGSPVPSTDELQLPEGSMVVSRHQQRFIDDIPWSLETSFYPMGLVERGAARLIQAGDIQEGGTVAYLRETLGIKQAGYHDTLTVRAPDNVESAFFKLPDDGRVSIIELRRTAFDEQGEPIRLTVSVYPADRNQFALNVGDVPEEVADPSSVATGEPDAGPDASAADGTERSG